MYAKYSLRKRTTSKAQKKNLKIVKNKNKTTKSEEQTYGKKNYSY